MERSAEIGEPKNLGDGIASLVVRCVSFIINQFCSRCFRVGRGKGDERDTFLKFEAKGVFENRLFRFLRNEHEAASELGELLAREGEFEIVRSGPQVEGLLDNVIELQVI